MRLCLRTRRDKDAIKRESNKLLNCKLASQDDQRLSFGHLHDLLSFGCQAWRLVTRERVSVLTLLEQG